MSSITPEDLTAFDEVSSKACSLYENSPYGNAWRAFTAEELATQAVYKARRFCLLPYGHPKQVDDTLDAINMLIFAVRKLEEERTHVEHTDTHRPESSTR